MCAKVSQQPLITLTHLFHVCQRETMTPIITLTHPFPCVPKGVNNPLITLTHLFHACQKESTTPSLLWPTFSMHVKRSQQPPHYSDPPFPCMSKGVNNPLITLTHLFHACQKESTTPSLLWPTFSMHVKRSQQPPHYSDPPFPCMSKGVNNPLITLTHLFHACQKESTTPSLLWPTFSMHVKRSQQPPHYSDPPFPCMSKGVNNPLITLTHLFHACQKESTTPSLLWPTFSMHVKRSQQPPHYSDPPFHQLPNNKCYTWLEKDIHRNTTR